MSPMLGHDPAVESRTKPSGRPIYYPVCAEWSCDDEYDWEWVSPDDPIYPEVKRERDIALYHQPRNEWRERLQQERDRLSGGKPLWWGRLQP